MPGTREYARTAWSFSCIACCGVHRRHLVRISPAFASTRLPDFHEALDLERGALVAGEEAEKTTVTELEYYYGSRADLREYPGGLAERLSLPNALRLSEWLGVAAVFGRNNSGTLQVEEIRLARDVGFRALQAGYDAVRALLDQISTPRPEFITAGGKGFYGSLYLRVLEASPASEFAWFRELLRDHLTVVGRVPAKAKAFGEIGARGNTTLNALSIETGLHPQTLQRYLSEHYGYEPGPGRTHKTLIPSESAAGVLSSFGGTVEIDGLTKLLGWSAEDCRRLARLEIIKPAAATKGPMGRVRYRYNSIAVAKVKERLVSAACGSEDGLKAMGRLRAVDLDAVFKAAFSGRLSRFGYREAGSLGKSLLVSRDEVLERFPKSGEIHCVEACRRLILETKALPSLFKLGVLEPAAGSEVSHSFISTASIERFEQTYVTFGYLKKESGLHQATLKSRMSLHGVTAAFTYAEIGATILTREDAVRLIGSKDVNSSNDD